MTEQTDYTRPQRYGSRRFGHFRYLDHRFMNIGSTRCLNLRFPKFRSAPDHFPTQTSPSERAIPDRGSAPHNRSPDSVHLEAGAIPVTTQEVYSPSLGFPLVLKTDAGQKWPGFDPICQPYPHQLEYTHRIIIFSISRRSILAVQAKYSTKHTTQSRADQYQVALPHSRLPCRPLAEPKQSDPRATRGANRPTAPWIHIDVSRIPQEQRSRRIASVRAAGRSIAGDKFPSFEVAIFYLGNPPKCQHSPVVRRFQTIGDL